VPYHTPASAHGSPVATGGTVTLLPEGGGTAGDDAGAGDGAANVTTSDVVADTLKGDETTPLTDAVNGPALFATAGTVTAGNVVPAVRGADGVYVHRSD